MLYVLHIGAFKYTKAKHKSAAMSGGPDMIASAVIQHVGSMLGDKAWERIKLLWNFENDAKEMKDKMFNLQVALNNAEKRSQESEDALARLWLKKYKSVAYDMEDTLDELGANAMIWRNSTCTAKFFFSSINPLVVRITISDKMRNIRVMLDKIIEEQTKFRFLTLPTPTSQDSKKKWRETFIGDRDEIEVIGREREKKDILTKVLQKNGEKESFIIPVVGLGGMGKTTLAKAVYTDKETNMFDVKAWVHVSMDFQLNKIVSAIISQVEGSTPANDVDLQYLKSQLDRILHGKIYLIVLDDLWEEERSKLEDLMNMLQSGMKGSNIIVTTRSEKVVSLVSTTTIHSSYFQIVDPIKLEGMSIDECWSIMKPRNLGNGQLTDLVDIGKDIAQRCSGVPLVAKALGYVMQKQCTREEWLEIKNSDILDIKDDDKGILKGLLLSYYHMPPQLQLCFMYCSIFPKNHDIDHDCLIQQWIALGFIQDTNGEQPLQKIGREYVNEFLGMSFLTNLTPTVPASRSFEPTLRLRMHDMVHDLARHVAGDELSCTNGVANSTTKGDKLICHYQLLMNSNESSSSKSLPPNVRAMHFRECNKLHVPKQAFSHALYLRVLDLSGCHVSELPGSVCKLKLLRYLDASNLPIPNFPKSLNRLLNLQTLILSNTSLKALPTNIGCLQKLQYFDLSGCVNLHELPTSFGNLSALLFLNLASCHELPTLPESFGKLHKLQFLNLSDCYKLHSLPESCCQLHDLTHLELSDCHNLEKVQDCIDQLSKLEYLNMTSCSKVQMLPESLCKLMMLKHLNLSFCVKLKHLPASIGVLQLQRLDLEGCFFLDGLPDSIFNMSTLVHVERAIFGLYIHSKVDKLREQLNLKRSCELDGRGDLWSQILELEKTPCLELEIKGLQNVKNLEGADQAKLLNNSNLRRLALSWEHGESSMVEHADASVDKSVLEKLVPPRNLQHLHLDGYMSIDFSRWMLDLPSYLPHLTTIGLTKLKGCSHLPPLGRLPNLRALFLDTMPNLKSVGREFYGDYGSCWKLRMILMEGMDNLEGWWTTRTSNEDEEFLIPNLHLLFASNCPKLKFLPYPPRSMTWMVNNSDHVLPEHGFGNLSSITSPYYLFIAGTSPSPEAWHRARYLCSIENLALGSLTGLTTLPEVIRCFISLRVFLVEDCDDLETLPEW
ncbi:hypothetical protein SEVIR_5G458201v4 [Setaria viridis]|uniref:NB-ARC domain-containing protein n=2 Tax=Setaria viridis TaxID=4556 RepID=A0A4U6UUC1_SETVI|nr:putative disease resistance protein RGA4 isoform X1 [Setaria viridis]XP_034596957.1 putative disease resistance protein RGA4 isoform X1 [Setaria viridis]XP_034596958.1 putative disease resistance protein RGA4 isoform X1 [Setaria viridis]XP_034596959.1 putative disease resistance protein RGA4 isoform X1 [Setaria viridis]XP_034596960.1 putative disease resistance protein RGA4 isoform X1 [Setaria viridis]XP_034596961.1 putative disease resistance protein RGA4 isoform X1 [Setaria viridis]TKW18